MFPLSGCPGSTAGSLCTCGPGTRRSPVCLVSGSREQVRAFPSHLLRPRLLPSPVTRPWRGHLGSQALSRLLVQPLPPTQLQQATLAETLPRGPDRAPCLGPPGRPLLSRARGLDPSRFIFCLPLSSVLYVPGLGSQWCACPSCAPRAQVVPTASLRGWPHCGHGGRTSPREVAAGRGGTGSRWGRVGEG